MELSWRVLEISLQYLNQLEVTELAIKTLRYVLPLKGIEEVQTSTVETCLAVMLEVWEKNFKKTKEVNQVFDCLGQLGEAVLGNDKLSQKSKMTVLELIGHRYNP